MKNVTELQKQLQDTLQFQLIVSMFLDTHRGRPAHGADVLEGILGNMRSDVQTEELSAEDTRRAHEMGFDIDEVKNASYAYFDSFKPLITLLRKTPTSPSGL